MAARRSTTGHRYRQALAVLAGTFAAAAAKAKPQTKPSRPVSALAMSPALAGRPSMVVSSGQPAVPHPALRQSGGGYVPGTAPARGADGILGRLAARNITPHLRYVGEVPRVWYSAPGGWMLTGYLQAVNEAEELIIGELVGQPPGCDFDHKGTPPKAIDVLAGSGLLVCEEHARQEVPDDA